MKIVWRLFEPHHPQQPIGACAITLDTYEKISATGAYRGQPKRPYFLLYLRDEEIMVRADIVTVRGDWPGMGFVQRYRLIVDNQDDRDTVARFPGELWRDVK